MALAKVWGTKTLVSGWSTALASVAASGTSTSGAITGLTQTHLKIEAEFTSDSASTQTVDIFILESVDTSGGFSTAQGANMHRIGSITLNGTTLVRKVFTVSNITDEFKFYIENNDTSNGLGTSEINYRTLTFNDV